MTIPGVSAVIIQFRRNSSVSWACVVSIVLLLVFCILQAIQSSVINLPAQWLWISVLPILLALVVGGYIGKFKGAGFEFEPGMRLLPYAQPTSSPNQEGKTAATGIVRSTEPKSPGAEMLRNQTLQTERKREYERTAYLYSRPRLQGFDSTRPVVRCNDLPHAPYSRVNVKPEDRICRR